jgi:branched chain amino acid efflux pump
MTAVWLTVAVLFGATFTMKAVGPVTFGGRRLSGRAAGVIGLVAPTLLASLVVYETFNAGGSGVEVDERLAGLAAAGVALALRRSMLVVVAAAAVATAVTRALV